MPKRRLVTSKELAKIINLHEKNASWLKVQDTTGVPRQIAKRAYMEHQLKLSSEELKGARQTVATEDLRWHFDCLIKVAESLVTTLDIPSFSDVRTAEDILLNLWEKNIIGENEARLSYKQPTQREINSRRRKNQRLFKSLQDHTYAKINYMTLDKWEAAWNRCKESRDKLKEETQEMLSNKRKGKPELEEILLKKSKGEHIIKQLANGIVYVIWHLILIGELSEVTKVLDEFEDETDKDDKVDEILERLKEQITSTVRAVSGNEGISEIIFGKTNPVSVSISAQAEKINKVVKMCMEIANTLCRGEKVKTLITEFEIMKESIDYLEEKLDPIFLRPTIHHSPKCELCPA